MDAPRIISVDIGGTKIASGLVTLGADEVRVEHVASMPTEAALGGAHVLERIIASARRVADLAGEGVLGIGVSSAGVIDPVTGDVTSANDIMPGWAGTKLGSELEAALGLPVRVLNDVHAHALGEARRGAGRDAKSSLMVAVGTGIGGAFVEDGRIQLGAHGVAGHIGHVGCAAAEGLRCACGGEGHVETIAAGPAIIEEYRRLTGDADPALDGAEIERRAAAGDKSAAQAQLRSARAIGEVVAGMCSMLDPELIILSGSVALSGAIWHDGLAEAFAACAMAPCKAIPIVAGALSGDAPLIGAAENLVRPAFEGVVPVAY